MRHLPDVTVIADAGRISEAKQKAIETAGPSFILGMKVSDAPTREQVAQGPWGTADRRISPNPRPRAAKDLAD
jgi:hypothetical protein